MTQRERPASGAVTGTASRPDAGLPLAGEPTGVPPAPSWDELTAQATPAQREELLALARRQGVVYARQLPALGNGSAAERVPPSMARILSGQVDELEPAPGVPLELHDAALTEEQREAVERALHTPDVCLIEGVPGAGKSRVIAELVLQAAARGERVLVISATAPAADRVLELLASTDEAYPVRCVEPGEPLDQLPVWSRPLTFAARLAQATTEPLEKARRTASDLDAQCRRLRGLSAAMQRLHALATAAESAGQQLRSLEGERAALAADAPRVSPGPRQGLLLTERDARRRELAGREAGVLERHARAAQEMAALEPRLAELRPLIEAKQAGRWWKPAWWTATLRSAVMAEHASLVEHVQKVRADLAALSEESRQLHSDRQQAEDFFAAELRRLSDVEAARLRDVLAAKEAALRGDLQAVRREWEAALAGLHECGLRPADVTDEACAAVEAQWRQKLQECEDQRTWTADWARSLEVASESAAERVAGYANVVCGTVHAWRSDPHFGDTANPVPVFDRMIVQEAEQLARADLLQLGPRARRWILVACVAGSISADPRSGRAGTAPTGVFRHLWQSLHLDPRRLPYEWHREQRRLVCRLRRLPAEQRGRLEREPVFDCPDVELRICQTPRGEPVLAEIAFPESFGFGQAKQYVFRELDELAIVPASPQMHWRETDAGVVLEFSAATQVEGVVIAPGVVEYLEARADAVPLPKTGKLVFERSQGWDRARAQDFAIRLLGLRDSRRTARLVTHHRAHSGLGAVISELLGQDPAESCPAHAVPTCANGCAAALEFVSVARVGDSTRPPAPTVHGRGGAGLELDLTDRRHRDRLPSELRPDLPERGFVNYLEACAIIRTLEDWAADASRVSETPAVAVIALYPSQSLLLRRLADRSTVLRQGRLRLEIGVPESFREREFPVVLVSLTRSHVHRAVAFGDGPGQLALALTRASRKLILFGDPGTLVRRGQWEGRLEHLNEADAAWERAWAERVVRYLEGTGRHQRLFHLREGLLT